MERRGNNNLFEHKTEQEDLALLIESAELPEESSVKEHCIYRVPQKIRQIKEAAYSPRVVSIGPFHHGQERLKLMEPLKLGYLKSFLNGTGLTLQHCISELKEWEPGIRNCYAESIPLESDVFLKMILIDAGFIIELFLRYYDVNNWVERDPLFLKPWLAEDVAHDLILLENQLPFFVLEGLYNLATKNDPDFPSFLQITFKYFEDLNQQAIQHDGVIVRHFTDLLRIFYLSPNQIFQKRSKVGSILEHLYCASELLESGVEFRVNKINKCLLELQYVKGVLTMPRLDVSDRTEIHLRNIVAFEQGHYPSETYITDYLKVLDFLVNTDKDVNVLVHKGIITTLLGDNSEVATMINRLCSNLIQANMNSKYLSICKELNDFYEKPVHKWKAGMIHDYFDTPVKTATSIAAIVLLILTLVQTICSVLSLL
ncbi:UPF0481 protein At3g47200-like isoform X1 [Diospyros lotus]|uniref:UPF0481 protein At3g47200-like isoform X1 n=1 Tax=Diospyros lotus TaxID=55363 RepID=UPI002250EE60|nr:UPF0481 protein At3g47200-like isoform X1 [Diospyros lotus]XP_052200153.1 UPF0481 protein At3g47200-like isoform X1 [Diospyros lotus]